MLALIVGRNVNRIEFVIKNMPDRLRGQCQHEWNNWRIRSVEFTELDISGRLLYLPGVDTAMDDTPVSASCFTENRAMDLMELLILAIRHINQITFEIEYSSKMAPITFGNNPIAFHVE